MNYINIYRKEDTDVLCIQLKDEEELECKPGKLVIKRLEESTSNL